MLGNGGTVAVPDGYGTGTLLFGSSTYAGKTFATLGTNQRSYIFTLPSLDAFTLNVGAVPEPNSTVALLGLGAVILRRWR